MGALISRLQKLFATNRQYEVSMLGLDAAGKTTILYQIKCNNTVSTIPTIGFNVEQFQMGGITFNVWDIGGQENIRPLWKNYVDSAAGLIYVVDIKDRERWGIAGKELENIIKGCDNKVVLILANKADDPNDENLESDIENMVRELDIEKYRITWKVFHVAAVDTPQSPDPLERLVPAFEWLVDALKNSDRRIQERSTLNG
ncbi:ADP-ribosylation factor 4 [Spraguea lophii 42_110]|uniref:ADP-ribosylation factor n=1 Tax=Spraguea lophii (strain 42_110) TaxID=1358809 RepID=S7W8S5_SPRLO|nr:ADP-ribosylation factor 4 [Spraguea lophii 42_110]